MPRPALGWRRVRSPGLKDPSLRLLLRTNDLALLRELESEMLAEGDLKA